jgi:hypothetical protein
VRSARSSREIREYFAGDSEERRYPFSVPTKTMVTSGREKTW